MPQTDISTNDQTWYIAHKTQWQWLLSISSLFFSLPLHFLLLFFSQFILVDNFAVPAPVLVIIPVCFHMFPHLFNLPSLVRKKWLCKKNCYIALRPDVSEWVMVSEGFRVATSVLSNYVKVFLNNAWMLNTDRVIHLRLIFTKLLWEWRSLYPAKGFFPLCLKQSIGLSSK